MKEENGRDRERNSKHLEYLPKGRAKHIKGDRLLEASSLIMKPLKTNGPIR